MDELIFVLNVGKVGDEMHFDCLFCEGDQQLSILDLPKHAKEKHNKIVYSIDVTQVNRAGADVKFVPGNKGPVLNTTFYPPYDR